MKAVVFLADGFEECEALIVVDLLRRAGIDTDMVSVMERLEVESSRHIIVRANGIAENINWNEVDLIFLPGGRLGTENMRKNSTVLEQCRRFAAKKKVAAICAAPSILADLGLLNGKRATCHPDYEDRMSGALVTGESLTVDGNIITGRGLGTTFEFAFMLISILRCSEEVERIKRAICYNG